MQKLFGNFEGRITSHKYQTLHKYYVNCNALIFFSFGDGRTEKTINSRSRRAIVFYFWVLTHRGFCVFYYRLENVTDSSYDTKYRVSTLLVVRNEYT